MSSRHKRLGIGGAAVLSSAFLFFVGIPYGISAPSNIRNIVLSPLFWPQILAGLIGLVGLGILVSAARAGAGETVAAGQDQTPDQAQSEPGNWLRLAVMTVILVVYLAAVPWIGLVWASIPAFIAVAFLIQTRHPKTAVIAAILVPLVLYAFFAHVAGVAVPQGEFVRLP